MVFSLLKFRRISLLLMLAGGLGLAASAVGAQEEKANVADDGIEKLNQPIDGTTVSINLVRVPGGTITVNDPANPGESVEVEVKPMWVSATEITWEPYDIFVFGLDSTSNEAADAVTRPSKPYLPPDRGFGHNGYAAISLAYKGADEFCKWLSAKTGRKYRLPTDAEWQYFVAAGATTDYSFGDDVELLKDHAFYEKNSGWQARRVGTREPNKWGIYDGHGNVAEWVAGIDGKPTTCGGSWLDEADALKLDVRRAMDPSWQMSDPQIPKSGWWLADCTWVGFRIVCEIEEGDGDDEETDESKSDSPS